MRDLYSELEELCETTANEIKTANQKIRSAEGKVSPSDMDYLDKLTHIMKSIKTTMAMMDAEDGYSGRDYSNRSYARRRDSMGRYTRANRGRSYDGGMMAELHELMEDAPDEYTRQRFQRFINEMERA